MGMYNMGYILAELCLQENTSIRHNSLQFLMDFADGLAHQRLVLDACIRMPRHIRPGTCNTHELSSFNMMTCVCLVGEFLFPRMINI